MISLFPAMRRAAWIAAWKHYLHNKQNLRQLKVEDAKKEIKSLMDLIPLPSELPEMYPLVDDILLEISLLKFCSWKLVQPSPASPPDGPQPWLHMKSPQGSGNPDYWILSDSVEAGQEPFHLPDGHEEVTKRHLDGVEIDLSDFQRWNFRDPATGDDQAFLRSHFRLRELENARSDYRLLVILEGTPLDPANHRRFVNLAIPVTPTPQITG